MRKLLVFCMVAALIFTLFAALPAVAQTGPVLDLMPEELMPQGTGDVGQQVIDVPPRHFEKFFAHISWPGHEQERLHIGEVSWKWWTEPTGGATSQVTQWYVEPTMYVHPSEWFPWNEVFIDGRPSTLIHFQADIVLHDASGGMIGPLDSNIVTKHITPEPSSLAALGMAAASMGGVVWRRRRK